MPKKKTLLRLLGGLAILAAVLVGGYFLFRALGWTAISREELQAWIDSTGVFAPLVFTVLSFLQVTFVPIPGAVTILAGAFLFGAWHSFLYSYIGMLAGSLVAFALGRGIGRPFVDWAFGGREEADSYLARLRGKEKVCLFFMFFLPAFPDDALCALAGILPITFGEFALMQVVTRVTSILGTLFFMSGEVIPYTPLGIAVIAAVGVLSIVAFVFCFRRADRFNALFDRLTDKVSHGLKRLFSRKKSRFPADRDKKT